MKQKYGSIKQHAHAVSFIFTFLCIFFIFISGCAEGKKDSDMTERKEKDTFRIMVTSDLHYLSRELYDPSSEVFAKLLATNDGKLIEEGETILNALKEKAKEEKPDALLLAGDITFNGEMISLKEIRTVLDEVEAAGIPVLVTTGNHDLYYSSSMTYFGNQPERTEDISDTEFAEVMGPFGYEEALYRDEHTLSYMYALNEDLWFLVLDANSLTSRGSIPGTTLLWMDEVLNRAEESGAETVVMCHQNILIQSPMMYMGYVLDNHEAVAHLLRAHNVYLSLSGHSHLQHTAEENGLTDICNESLAVYPLQYGMITLNPAQRSFSHELKTLGILEEEAYARFGETVMRMVETAAWSGSDDPLIQKQMIDYALALNAAYFSGNIEKMQSLKEDERLKLWRQYGSDSFWALYLENIISELEGQE